MVGIGLAEAAVPPQIGVLLLFALVGLFAGAVRAAQRPAPRPAMRDVCNQACGGCLTSFLAGATLLNFWGTEHPYLALVIAGVAGWVGTVLLDRAGQILVSEADRRLLPPPPLPTTTTPPPAAATVAPIVPPLPPAAGGQKDAKP